MPVKDGLITIDEALEASKEQVKEWYKKYFNPSFELILELAEFDAIYDKADGTTVYADGQSYLDFLGGHGAVGISHNHPEILASIQKVMGRPNILQAALSPLTAALAKNLALITPGDLEKSFFCNSGAEAVEGALKIARAATGRKKIIYTENSFHGKTFGALSATGKEKYRAPFTPLIPGFEAVPFGDSQALEQKLSQSEAAAFIVEPIQGEGGIILPPQGYLKEVERICRKYRTLLIMDEIQTGLGRTGKMFACEYEDVEPDVICLAKALGGAAVPMGAYVVTDKVWQRAYGGIDRCLIHTTTTFGGTAWGCAAALATINVLCRDSSRLIHEAKDKGEYFLTELKKVDKFDVIKETRGKGLMIGVEFNQPRIAKGKINQLFKEYFAQLVVSQLRNNYNVLSVYTLNNPNVIRFMPPLTVNKEDIAYTVSSLEKLCLEGFSGTLIAGGMRAGKQMGGGNDRKQHLSQSLHDQLANPLEEINLPNALTILRLLLIPVFIYLVLSPENRLGLAAFTLAVAGATDWLDGFAARRLGKVTEFGTFFDPLVDRLLIFSVLALGFIKEIVPLWTVMVIFGRDIFMILGYQYLRARKKKLSLTFLGKGTTALIAVSFVLLLLKISLGLWLFYLSVLLSFVSGLDYFRKGLGKLRGAG